MDSVYDIIYNGTIDLATMCARQAMHYALQFGFAVGAVIGLFAMWRWFLGALWQIFAAAVVGGIVYYGASGVLRVIFSLI